MGNLPDCQLCICQQIFCLTHAPLLNIFRDGAVVVFLDDEKNADFVNAYKDKYGDTPDQFAADAYDGVHAVAEALKEAGLGVDADPTEAAEKLSKAMLKITVDGLTGKLTWNDKGQVQKEPTAYVITDGKYVQA